MRPRLRSSSGPSDNRAGRPLELVRVRGAQRDPRHEGRELAGRSRRRGGRGRGRGRSRGGAGSPPPPPAPRSLWDWLRGLFSATPEPRRERASALSEQEARALDDFSRHFRLTFNDPSLLKLALTHRSYLSVTGQGPRESNERLEFLGDSVLGLVTSEFLYRAYPNEHEGHLTKIKSLLVSKAILSRRALAMGLGRFVLMSHSEVESGGRQRLSILADAFEAVLGAIYLDQGFETARRFIDQWLLRDSSAITADERHVNYKSHLQEYVQSTFHTHPVYRIRSEYGPDHSKHFNVDVMVGRRVLGSGKGRNKKEAEQAAARAALDEAGALPRKEEPVRRAAAEERGESEPVVRTGRADADTDTDTDVEDEAQELEGHGERRSRRRGRRGGRGRRSRERAPESPGELDEAPASGIERREEPEAEPASSEVRVAARPSPRRWSRPDEEFEEVGRPEGPLDERHVDPYDWESPPASDQPAEEIAAEPDLAPHEPPAPGVEDAPRAPRRGVAAVREERIEALEEPREIPAQDRAPRPEPPAAGDAPSDSGGRTQPQFGRRSSRVRRPGGR